MTNEQNPLPLEDLLEGVNLDGPASAPYPWWPPVQPEADGEPPLTQDIARAAASLTATMMLLLTADPDMPEAVEQHLEHALSSAGACLLRRLIEQAHEDDTPPEWVCEAIAWYRAEDVRLDVAEASEGE